MRAPLTLLAVVASLAWTPVQAEVYKWVDKQGKVHYSDQAPKGVRMRSIEDRLSLYSPEPALAQALQRRAQFQPTQDSRAAQLERQLQAERLARRPSSLADQRAQAYQQCLAEGRTDCDPVLGTPAS